MSASSVWFTMFWQGWFAISGVGISLVAELLDERGAGNPITAFQQFSQFAVMFLCGVAGLTNPILFIRQIKNIKHWHLLASLVVFDLFGSVFTMSGVYFLGSGLFQIMYSMVIPLSALFQNLILGKSLHFIQWISIFIILCCLTLSCYAEINVSSKRNLIIGLSATFISTVCNSLYYVFITKLTSVKATNNGKQVSVYTYCALEGLINALGEGHIDNLRDLCNTPRDPYAQLVRDH
eukprot:196596_1